jgi:hypothetical protein
MLIDSLLKYNYGLSHDNLLFETVKLSEFGCRFNVVIKSSVNVTGTKCARRRSFNLKRFGRRF